MTEASGKQILRSWLILLALTGASVLAVRFGGSAAELMLVLCFALLKVRFVVLDFMELRQQTTMRRALIGWCMILAASAASKTVLATIASG
jgi:hypothetical protein